MIAKRSRPLLAALLVVAGTAAILWLMGRPPLCTCGEVDWWVNRSGSPRTSQMLADWYSLSHVVHGFLFYGAFALLLKKAPVEHRFLYAVVLESAWELVENSPAIIQRYREATIALGYNGDSILNSVSDIGMMAVGFLLARKLPIWASLVLVLALELVPLYLIRDNLTLNIWMLLAPTDWLRAWQAGA